MFKKAGILFLCFALAQCSEKIDLMDRPLHTKNNSFQTEEHRLLPMDGSHNTRELGGYKTTDGKTIKWGKLFRSDKLSDISKTDQAYLQNLGIKKIVDFRSEQEKAEDPNIIPTGISYVEMPISVDGAMRSKIEAVLKGETDREVQSFLIDANKEFVTNYADVYENFLRGLIDEDAPTLFHCTAGKDRAGFAAAITLIALGVSKEDVINDYMKTNAFTQERIEEILGQIELMSLYQSDVEILRPLLGVEQIYIETAFRTAEDKYGSLENFIRDGLNISDEDIQKLRNKFLEG
ncbi:MAG: tyrosine-protein phosphatase [SAR86 cluster bacterium]|nr:tyrosine-protein phosphatase [SAR86 cluster bacterium]MBL6822354.1 tyrosine-protein phosphatase [SAR86 cluster bacterium]MDB0010588.1 tyrosine-protein phosphatase [Gammaproteobacteria bacterium]|tara:strand:+ start:34 stop:909 length:876 start_codon:yes stop_codon:yes gene_type:complete